MWGTYWQQLDIDKVNRLSRREIVLLPLFAYILGHAIQAIGNSIEDVSQGILDRLTGRAKSWIPRRVASGLSWLLRLKGGDHYLAAIPEAVSSALVRTVSTAFGLSGGTPDGKTMYALCDAAILQEGATGALEEREIYTYREGFYRGTFVGLSLVTASLFVPLWTKAQLLVAPGQKPFSPSPCLIVVTILAVASSACLFFRRYLRFRQRRIAFALSGFLALTAIQKPRQEERNLTNPRT